ncbi:GIY-YIG nuclease family protein [Halobacteriovorax sp. HLS]|uniref:GIY-YIG nuclease family protein n=1 Tax=Halobacteriovorax sp. HLS TaxID=2234000 RepID=UPI000FDA81E6|nr:GIY-YIG nuclease family protein [Halobacteriovorax sp. HLS]
MSWFVYIIETTSNKFYTGITTDVERRFNEHLNDKKKGAKFFRSNRPKKVVYIEEFENRSLASKREYEIKQLTRQQKEKLLKSIHQ